MRFKLIALITFFRLDVKTVTLLNHIITGRLTLIFELRLIQFIYNIGKYFIPREAICQILQKLLILQ